MDSTLSSMLTDSIYMTMEGGSAAAADSFPLQFGASASPWQLPIVACEMVPQSFLYTESSSSAIVGPSVAAPCWAIIGEVVADDRQLLTAAFPETAATRRVRRQAPSAESAEVLTLDVAGVDRTKKKKKKKKGGGGAASAVAAVQISDERLATISVRELNGLLQGCDRKFIRSMKRKRRTLKNRGYASKCRVKRVEVSGELQRENKLLRAENDKLRRDLHLLQQSMRQREASVSRQERNGAAAVEIADGLVPCRRIGSCTKPGRQCTNCGTIFHAVSVAELESESPPLAIAEGHTQHVSS